MVLYSGVIVTMRNRSNYCNSYMHLWTESDVHLSSSLHGRPTTLIICWTWATISTGVASLENVARRPWTRLMTWPERSSTGPPAEWGQWKHIRKRDCHLISSYITINCASCKGSNAKLSTTSPDIMTHGISPPTCHSRYPFFSGLKLNNPIHPCWGSTKMSTKVQVWTENLGYQC